MKLRQHQVTLMLRYTAALALVGWCLIDPAWAIFDRR
jgi:hypothetical protein